MEAYRGSLIENFYKRPRLSLEWICYLAVLYIESRNIVFLLSNSSTFLFHIISQYMRELAHNTSIFGVYRMSEVSRE